MVVVARRIGLSPEEYAQRVANGEKWCTAHKAWHDISAFPVDRSRYDGRKAKCLLADHGRPRGRRDPLRERARKAVAYAIRKGHLLSPNVVRCLDCGHWGRGRRHDYDHHLGYEREHWLHVEPVCTLCHADREQRRAG